MAFKLIGAKKAPYDADGKDEVIKEFLCDTDADFDSLPECDPGSSAVSISSAKVYVVNTQGKWVPFGEGDTSDDGILPGVYKFNDVLTLPEEDLYSGGMKFTSYDPYGFNGGVYESIMVPCDLELNSHMTYKRSGPSTSPYDFITGTWAYPDAATVTIEDGPNFNNGSAVKFAQWFKANTVKISDL